MRTRNKFLVVILISAITLLALYYASINRQVPAVKVTTVTTYILKSVESPSYEICFSPQGNCESLILYLVRKANLSIHVMVYTLTLDKVGDALIDAHKRGIDVKVILDRSNAQEGSEYEKLMQAGVLVKLHQGPGLMHNKVAIIDGSTTITGSYNWTGTAEHENDENLIVIRSAEISNDYEEEFDRIWSLS